MKSSIVKQLSAIKVETVERLQQTSSVIAEATSVISEVTVEAQVRLNTLCVRVYCHCAYSHSAYFKIGGFENSSRTYEACFTLF